MPKKLKVVTISLFSAVIVFVGIYAFSNKTKEVHTVEASTVGADELAKQSIQDKMLNSIDYFKRAKGSFRYYTKKDNTDYIVDFDVKLNGKPSSYVKTINNNDQTSDEVTFDGNKRLYINNKNKTYHIDSVMNAGTTNQAPPKQAKQRYFKDENGKKNGFIIANDPSNMGIANSVLYNQNVALGLLQDYSKWDISGNDVFLGLPATVITGELPDMYKPRFDGTSFKMLVHKDTGIILNLEVYNASKQVVCNIKVNNIKVNNIKVNSTFTKSDEEKFKIKTPANYKRNQPNSSSN